jgi:hypothetical protein
MCGYFSFLAIAKGIYFLLVIFVPPMLFLGFFAFPWSREQPTEVWALAKIRFMLKPRRRIWDQSGVKELVTITAPKKVQKTYTDNLTQTEVRSRLNALASTIDSRGWAVKNVNVNLYAQPSPFTPAETDRLVEPSSMPQEVSNIDITAGDDMLDAQNNPIAQQFDAMIAASARAHRDQIVSNLNSNQPQQAGKGQPPADYWFLNQPSTGAGAAPIDAMAPKPQMVYPGADDSQPAAIPAAEPTAAEQEIIEKNKRRGNPFNFAYSHLKNIQPLGSKPATNPPLPAAANNAVTPLPDPAKIDLARNNDLNISTLARLANKKEPPEDEVVVPLR